MTSGMDYEKTFYNLLMWHLLHLEDSVEQENVVPY